MHMESVKLHNNTLLLLANDASIHLSGPDRVNPFLEQLMVDATAAQP